MGQKLMKEQFFHAIDSNNLETIKYCLLRDQSLANEYLDQGHKALPITRAVWLGYEEAISMLLMFGAEVNKKVSNGYTAIFYACERGRNATLQKLLQVKDINIEEVDENGYTAMDVAINLGYYNCALTLYKAGLQPKSTDFYGLKKNYFAGYRVDFEWFIKSLKERKEMEDKEANKYLFIEKERV